MTGNMHGLHRKEGEEREEHDFYATHPSAIPPLLRVLGWENGGKYIYEPCCGRGHLSEALVAFGHKVLSTDLVDCGYGIGGVDFLRPTPYDSLPFDAIITNPPYSHALECVKRSIELAPVACHFLNIRFLESAKRREFFNSFPPRYVCVFGERIPSSKNGLFPPKESSAVCYSWFIWMRGFTGRPEIIWL